MSATARYIDTLSKLKPGELGLLRTHAGQGLDESLDGFDLFAGIWWPLRQHSEFTPRREVAWLVAKLFAARPMHQSPGDTLARQLRRYQPNEDRAKERFRQQFDGLLLLPIDRIEPMARWALGLIAKHSGKVDWVKLTDDFSKWEHESIRRSWAEQFLEASERGQSC